MLFGDKDKRNDWKKEKKEKKRKLNEWKDQIDLEMYE